MILFYCFFKDDCHEEEKLTNSRGLKGETVLGVGEALCYKYQIHNANTECSCERTCLITSN